MDSIETKYWSQSRSAKSRGIGFTLTFEQWWDIWDKSGQWDERGYHKGQYVMSRRGDIGPYEIGNVFIQTQADNRKDSHSGNKWNVGKKHSPERVAKRVAALLANKKQGVING